MPMLEPPLLLAYPTDQAVIIDAASTCSASGYCKTHACCISGPGGDCAPLGLLFTCKLIASRHQGPAVKAAMPCAAG